MSKIICPECSSENTVYIGRDIPIPLIGEHQYKCKECKCVFYGPPTSDIRQEEIYKKAREVVKSER